MNALSWAERAERNDRAQKDHDHNRELQMIVAGIKSALAQNHLSRLQSATRHLCNHPDRAPEVVARLNATIGGSFLTFRWFPGTKTESGQLLIRGASIGLLIKTAPDSTPEGWMMTDDRDAPFGPLTAKSALTALSRQATKGHVAIRRANHAAHLQLCNAIMTC